MNLKEIDQALETWKAELPRMVTNQLELEDHETFHLLKLTPLEGRTRDRVAPVLEAVAKNWTYFSLLESAIKRAQEARSQVPTFGQARALARIEEILTGPSIELPAIPVPFEKRSLTSDTQIIPTITPGELKKQAIAAFEATKRVIGLLNESWKVLEELAGPVEREAQDLERQAAGADFSSVRQRIRDFHHKRRADPFSFTLESDERLWPPAAVKASIDVFLGPALEKVRAGVRAIEEEKQALTARLRAGAAHLEHLARRREKALQLYQESQTELKSVEGLMAPPSLRDLARQLQSLDDSARAGDWGALKNGLAAWEHASADVTDATERAVSANRTRLSRLRELRSRWMAARSRREEGEKAGLVVDRALERFGERAEHLTTVEIDLDQAEQMIYSYEVKLAELLNRMRK